MDERELTRLVREAAGLRGEREAKRAIAAVLGALGCALEDDDALAASGALPNRLAAMLERRSRPVRSASAFYGEVQRRERVSPGFAREHAQSVLAVLSEQLEPELVSRLRRHLGPDIASLLRPRRVPARPPPHVHAHPMAGPTTAQTLSRARPGSAEPVAETRHELAHAGSIARSRAAHAERMVETARSTRPGREDETLAGARGRSGRA